MISILRVFVSLLLMPLEVFLLVLLLVGRAAFDIVRRLWRIFLRRVSLMMLCFYGIFGFLMVLLLGGSWKVVLDD